MTIKAANLEAAAEWRCNMAYSVDWEVARDIMAVYYGHLLNTVRILEEYPNLSKAGLEKWREGELDAFRKEKARIWDELHCMNPDDQDIINKAFFIYSPMAKYLEEEYLKKEPGFDESCRKYREMQEK